MKKVPKGYSHDENSIQLCTKGGRVSADYLYYNKKDRVFFKSTIIEAVGGEQSYFDKILTETEAILEMKKMTNDPLGEINKLFKRLKKEKVN